eukprot:CAMPEP_0198291554 /NCGR_PEP_ID=MMETSP1449-20131203/9043_1 /TAXON_ID=420275 /ORGANISM="Attheya septentrionalis, Strain CCMP2084" /LENGTH=260 /DNA_ID=CAMNT_0043990207 /DNA_START=99 /DNA_END=881 /DNA_ORIENTATION=-
MKIEVSILSIVLGQLVSGATCFVSNNHYPQKQWTTALQYRNLPSVGELSTDDFTDQVYHASVIVRELSELTNIQANVESGLSRSDASSKLYDIKLLSELLKAQLSHLDGMRGFFTVYLTGEGLQTVADKERMPGILLDAVKMSNFESLASMACMNLIIATAMTSAHQDETLAANSAIVAKRAKRLLSLFKGSAHIERNCIAILVLLTVPENATHAVTGEKELVDVRSAVPYMMCLFVCNYFCLFHWNIIFFITRTNGLLN